MNTSNDNPYSPQAVHKVSKATQNPKGRLFPGGLLIVVGLLSALLGLGSLNVSFALFRTSGNFNSTPSFNVVVFQSAVLITIGVGAILSGVAFLAGKKRLGRYVFAAAFTAVIIAGVFIA